MLLNFLTSLLWLPMTVHGLGARRELQAGLVSAACEALASRPEFVRDGGCDSDRFGYNTRYVRYMKRIGC